jgi:hypothetical protein
MAVPLIREWPALMRESNILRNRAVDALATGDIEVVEVGWVDVEEVLAGVEVLEGFGVVRQLFANASNGPEGRDRECLRSSLSVAVVLRMKMQASCDGYCVLVSRSRELIDRPTICAISGYAVKSVDEDVSPTKTNLRFGNV